MAVRSFLLLIPVCYVSVIAAGFTRITELFNDIYDTANSILRAT